MLWNTNVFLAGQSAFGSGRGRSTGRDVVPREVARRFRRTSRMTGDLHGAASVPEIGTATREATTEERRRERRCTHVLSRRRAGSQGRVVQDRAEGAV